MKFSTWAGSAMVSALALFVAAPASAVDFGYTGGFQTWLVPVTGSYQLSVYGAAGGNTATYDGGKGEGVFGVISLTAGDTLDVAVGGRGNDGVSYQDSHPGAGGGGASWVAVNLYDILAVAAGGGGAGSGFSVNYSFAHGSASGKGADTSRYTPYDNNGHGGQAGIPYETPDPRGIQYHGGGGGGAGAFGAGGDGAAGGGQGGGHGNYPGYVNGGLAPGGGPSGYGGFGGGGGGDAFGAGGGGGGFTGGNGGETSDAASLFYNDGSVHYGAVPTYGVGGEAGLSIFLGDSLTSLCDACSTGNGFVSLTYIIPTGGGGHNANPIPGAVPEPASWAMMVGGFGLVGGALRTRKRPTVRFA